MISTPEKNLQPTNKTEKKLFRSATIQERMINPSNKKETVLKKLINARE